MKKFIMILAGIAMLGAVVVGLINKNDIDFISSELVKYRGLVKDATEKLGETEDKRDDLVQQEVQAKDGRNQAAAAVETVKQELKIVERSLADVMAQLKSIEIEQKEIDLAIRKQFPDGNIKTADDLKMTLTMLKDTLTDKQNEKADKTAQMEAAKQAQQVQIARVEDEEEYQVERAQKLSLNSLVATVVAVNREWGFVMVNAGRAHGVEPDSSLLVKRGNLRVGRLRIVSLEDMMTVADVVDENGVSGITVKPGDKVIFESTN